MKKIVITFTIVLLVLITLAVLGNKERVGYLEVLKKSVDKDYTYQVRIRYYDKVFRNNDIYSVHVNTNNNILANLNIKWDGSGSPFGNVTSKNELEVGSKLTNIKYKLLIKTNIFLYLIFTIMTILTMYYMKRKGKLDFFFSTEDVLLELNKSDNSKKIFLCLGIVGVIFIFTSVWVWSRLLF